MAKQMTADEWNQVFPTWPKNGSDLHSVSDLMGTKYVEVVSAIFLPEHWPGIVEPDKNLSDTLLFRAGRWCVTESGITCLGQHYTITSDRLEETDWFAHLLEKAWFYDPSDMLDALEAARVHLLPHELLEQHETAIGKQIETALERQLLPYYPSRILQEHVYLVSRMSDEERAVFCQFLADKAFVPSP